MISFRIAILGVALCLAACATNPAAVEPRLTFLHLNDTYRIDAVEDGTRGGFARVTTLIRDLRDDGRDVRLLHGGDFLYPSLESQLWDGRQMVAAFNFMDALAPMYVVPGNHEFDPRGPGALIEAVRQSEFEWLAANQVFATGEADVDGVLEASYVETMGPYRVGIFGLNLHPDDGGNDRDYAPIRDGYRAHAEAAIRELESRGVDVIIGLTHLHLENDRELAGLRATHPKFVLIAGGHEHEPEFEPGTPERAAIVKGASNARTIWRIDLAGDPAEGVPAVAATRIELDEDIVEDPAYDAFAAEWRERLLERMPILESKLGEAAVRLDGRETTVRNEESNWANFIVDRMPGAFGGPPADLAFLNGGTLRIDDYVAGDITYEDVARTFGFPSYMRRMTIRGAAFRELLEAGYRGEGPSKGYFPQVSGFRVCVDRGRPDGSRIVALEVERDGEWRPIDPEADYSLVAPDYLYNGGDGYDFSAARDATPPGSELKYRVVDAIVEAQKFGKAVGAPVNRDAPRVDILHDSGDTCFETRTSDEPGTFGPG